MKKPRWAGVAGAEILKAIIQEAMTLLTWLLIVGISLAVVRAVFQ